MTICDHLLSWYWQERRNLRFLKKNWRHALVWPLIGAATFVFLWGAVLNKLEGERESTQAKLQHEASSRAVFYAKHLFRLLERTDELALYAKFYLEGEENKAQLERLAAHGLLKRTYFSSFSVIGSDGTLLKDMRPFQQGASLSNQPYFDYHSRSSNHSLRIGTPTVNKLPGKRTIELTRRLENRDGSFAGVLVVNVPLDFFSPVSNDSEFGDHNLFAVLDKGDAVLISGVGNAIDISGQSIFKKIPPSVESETAGQLTGKEWFSNGKPYFLASAAVAGSPFRAVVAMPEQENMRPFEIMTAAYYRAGAVASAILFIFTMMAMNLSVRLAIRKDEEEEMRGAYRAATETGHEGFYLWQIIREQSGEVVDFGLVDCNERGAEIYGMSKAKLMGSRVSELFPDAHAASTIQLFRTVCEYGAHEDEIEPHANSRLRAQWLRRKIVPTREGVAVTLRDISDLQQSKVEMERMTVEDALTGLANRYWLTMELPALLARAEASHTKLALLFIDLDDFKDVNDTLGHSAGDEMLKMVAARLSTLVRPGDKVVRLGGDEFTVILDPVVGVDFPGRVASQIVKAFKEPFELSQGRHYVGTSIGISLYPQDAQDAEALIKSADLAMYCAKDVKGHFCFYERDLYQRFRHRLELEQELHTALDEDQFVVYYQPRVEPVMGELQGFEALVRWEHPTKGAIAPSDFIPVAEESDIIIKLGALVMHKACAQIAQWRHEGLPVLPVSINVSARQFNLGGVKSLLDQCLQQYRLGPALVEIELTESTMMGENENIRNELDEIKAMGVNIHVDDFGTGYSSLARLQQLNLDVLKVDQAFTSKLGLSREGTIFVRAIISLAHALGMTVVAEGVETEEQLRILQTLECDEIQGFYISKPLPAADIPVLIARRWLLPTVSNVGIGAPFQF